MNRMNNNRTLLEVAKRLGARAFDYYMSGNMGSPFYNQDWELVAFIYNTDIESVATMVKHQYEEIKKRFYEGQK